MKLLLRLALITLFLPHNALTSRRAPGESQKTADSQKEFCTLAGTVVRAGSNEPIRKAQIVLSEQNAKDSTTVISYTDVAGRFSIDQIHPGIYRLHVERSGFVSQEYGGVRARHASSLLTLRPAQNIPDLIFRLIPTGVITGRVVDADGEPVEEAEVVAMYASSKQGRPLSTHSR